MQSDLALISLASIDMTKAEVYEPMLVSISENLPAMQSASMNFGKSQSQFMDNMMTVSHPTPIRNLRQILAEVEQVVLALKESHYRTKRAHLEIEDLTTEIEKLQASDNSEDRRVLRYKLLDLEEKESGLDTGKKYVEGAIRKIVNYSEQYNNILKSLGVSTFDEVDFEAEEERYHIMTAFNQALNAARSHGGVIDEGNQIYLFQIGINGGMAQNYIYQYLLEETKMIDEANKKIKEYMENPTSENLEVSFPDHSMVLNFLNTMAERFKGCSQRFAENKGMTTLSSNALLTNHTPQR